MKKRLLTLLLMVPILLAAAQSDLASKIARLQDAPKSERFKLMNQIKRELARMNSEQRSKTMRKLRASMHGGDKTGQHNGKHGQAHRSGMMHGREHNGILPQRQEMMPHHQTPSPARGGNEHRPIPQTRPEPNNQMHHHKK